MKSFRQTIKESVSTTSKKEIVKKADMGFAGYINDLKNALQDIKNEDYEWARYRIEGVADALKKLAPALKEWNSLNKAGKLTESKKLDYSEIDLENIAGGIKVSDGYDGLYVQSYSGGSGFNKLWKSDEFLELVKQSQEKRDYRPIRLKIEAITNDLLKVANDFDKGIESVMKKHGFKK